MNMIAQNPLFAFGARELIGIAFVVFTVISWVANALKEKNQQPARPARRRPAPDDDPLQSEIDIFIQEVTQQRGERPPARQTASRPAAKPRRLAAEERTPKTADPSAQKHDLPGGDIASRKSPGSKNFGQGVQQHVQEHIQSHSVAQESAQRLRHNVTAGVAQHLGKTEPVQVEEFTESPMIVEVRKLLSNPATAGQAILLHEILTSPRQRRR